MLVGLLNCHISQECNSAFIYSAYVMVGESTYLGYFDPPEKICNISSQAKISSSWTFLLLKLANLASVAFAIYLLQVIFAHYTSQSNLHRSLACLDKA